MVNLRQFSTRFVQKLVKENIPIERHFNKFKWSKNHSLAKTDITWKPRKSVIELFTHRIGQKYFFSIVIYVIHPEDFGWFKTVMTS